MATKVGPEARPCLDTKCNTDAWRGAHAATQRDTKPSSTRCVRLQIYAVQTIASKLEALIKSKLAKQLPPKPAGPKEKLPRRKKDATNASAASEAETAAVAKEPTKLQRCTNVAMIIDHLVDNLELLITDFIFQVRVALLRSRSVVARRWHGWSVAPPRSCV